MISALEKAIVLLRMGMEGEGNSRLVQFLDGFLANSDQASILTGAEILIILQNIIEAQSRGDFLLIADLLEYSVLPKLRSSEEQF